MGGDKGRRSRSTSRAVEVQFGSEVQYGPGGEKSLFDVVANGEAMGIKPKEATNDVDRTLASSSAHGSISRGGAAAPSIET